MNKSSFAKAVLCSAAVAFFASTAGAAQPGPTLPAGKTMSRSDIGTLTHDPRKLVTTYVSAGNGGGSGLSAGFNFIESRTVKCGNAAGCHIGQESMVQVSTTGNWAICLSVNGSYTTCQYQGNLPDVGSYVVGNARGFSVSVPTGTHTVQTEVYVDVASSLAQWQTDHRVYKP